DFLIAETRALQTAHRVDGHRLKSALYGLLAELDDLGELPQKPGIDLRALEDLLDLPAFVERAEDIPHPPVVRDHEAFAQRGVGVAVGARHALGLVSAGREQQPAASELERPHALHERFLEGPPDRHGLADRLHLCGQRTIGLRKLLEVPPRDLDHDVVDGGFEAGRRETRDVEPTIDYVVVKIPRWNFEKFPQ